MGAGGIEFDYTSTGRRKNMTIDIYTNKDSETWSLFPGNKLNVNHGEAVFVYELLPGFLNTLLGRKRLRVYFNHSYPLPGEMVE